jgi:spermidine/putrescine transport system ATP-binding protein
MTVEENVAFGLKYQKATKQESAERVGKALELVQMTQFAKRRPNQLSGGQQQRVALARALILNPKVLLLDEPLGALDAKLRKRLQIELKALQEEVGITFIYVTHDQEEALTMSDRIAVMSQGRVEQVGAPKDIYESPATAYVADFLGVSNLMDAQAAGLGDGGCKVTLGDFQLVAGQGDTDTTGAAKITIRPERVAIEQQGSTGENRLPAIVERTVYVGSILQVILHLASGQTIQAWIANTGSEEPFRSGDAVVAHFPRESLRVLPEGGTAVLESAELDVTTADAS